MTVCACLCLCVCLETLRAESMIDDMREHDMRKQERALRRKKVRGSIPLYNYSCSVINENVMDLQSALVNCSGSSTETEGNRVDK